MDFFVKKKVNDAAKSGSFTVGDVSVSTGENQKWPTNIPSNIPKFTAGKIEGSGRVGSNWSLTITDVSRSQLDSYRGTLSSQGWTIDSESDLGSIYSFTAQKGTWSISPLYTPAEKSLVLGINQTESSE